MYGFFLEHFENIPVPSPGWTHPGFDIQVRAGKKWRFNLGADPCGSTALATAPGNDDDPEHAGRNSKKEGQPFLVDFCRTRLGGAFFPFLGACLAAGLGPSFFLGRGRGLILSAFWA